jgi:hypothetical protein
MMEAKNNNEACSVAGNQKNKYSNLSCRLVMYDGDVKYDCLCSPGGLPHN